MITLITTNIYCNMADWRSGKYARLMIEVGSSNLSGDV